MNFLLLIFGGLTIISVNVIKAQIVFPSYDDDTESSNSCRTPSSESGLCIPLEQCTDLFNLLLSGSLSNQQVSFLRRSRCGNMNGKVLICCRTRSIRQPQSGNSGNANENGISESGNANGNGNRIPASGNANGTGISSGKANGAGISSGNANGNGISESGKEISESGASLLPSVGVCGVGASDRIFGGNKTNLGEFPWMALIEFTKGGNEKGHHCGGSLINNRYVVTAGHCYKKIPDDWKLTGVRLGDWDRTTNIDCVTDIRGYKECSDPHLDIPVEKIILHQNYDANVTAQYNDIALLRLARTVPFTDWISPICLPSANNLRTEAFDGVSLDVAGWGQTEAGITSPIKLKAFVNVHAIKTCNSIYAQSGVILRDGQMCAGGVDGIDSCQGDSGGPLIGLDTTNRFRFNYILVGIVSFGPTPCGKQGWPGVYTRVGKYVDWIIKNIQP